MENVFYFWSSTKIEEDENEVKDFTDIENENFLLFLVYFLLKILLFNLFSFKNDAWSCCCK